MQRHNWLIAMITALFVLQAPICALACQDDSADQASANSAPAASDSTAGMSCHESGDDASAAGESKSPGDCGCDVSSDVFVSQQVDSQTSGLTGLLPARVARSNWVDTSRRDARPDAFLAELPPPDILLGKSTLLL